jgi:hypothetical protein
MWSWTDIDLFLSYGHIVTLFANEREAMKEVPWLGFPRFVSDCTG